jgi:putative PIN family toxin of toxin-antitoxin system
VTRRVVLDTNTVVSALLWRGVAYRLLLETRRHPVRLYTSRFLLEELTVVLHRPKFDPVFALRETSRPILIQSYQALTHMVNPVLVPDIVKDDPADNQVLACALTAEAEVIVSGDSHLLSLKESVGANILSAGAFLARLAPD